MGSPNSPPRQDNDQAYQPTNPPAPPNPADDPGVVPSICSPRPDEGSTPEELDIFLLTPVAALKMLCRSIDALVRFTGDVPPTPPVRSRNPSPQRLSLSSPPPTTPQKHPPLSFNSLSLPGQTHDAIDGVPFAKTPIGSPEAHLSEPTAIIGEHAQSTYVQHGAIARKFYSKRPPPISTTDYLLRMHKYCPMSTAVYLATSCYITRLSVVEKLVPVTGRNVHRLLLAGLRVAMKALEDLSWPHSRFSKVGGVTEMELGRLEITFCFLMGFELKVDAEMLQREVVSLSQQYRLQGAAVMDSPVSSPGETRMELKIPPVKRKASSVLPGRPKIDMEAAEVA